MRAQRFLRILAAVLPIGFLACLGPPPGDVFDASEDPSAGDDGAKDGTAPQDGLSDAADTTRPLDADAGTQPDANPDSQEDAGMPEAATCTAGSPCSPAPCQL